MSKSLEQLNAQIAKLQKEAQALMAKEVATVVAQIKALIAKHGLTAEDVGLGAAKAAAAPKKVARKAKAAPAKAPKAAVTKAPKAAKKAAKAPKAPKSPKGVKASKSTLTAGVIKYRDEAGNAWTGRGKRPQWYLAALASGKTAEQLLAS